MDIKINYEKLANLAKKHDIRFIVLFGSHAQNATRPESDVDIALFFDRDKNVLAEFEMFSDVLNGLSEALGVPSEKLDLLTLNKANILLRYEITAGGKLLYGNADLYEQYQAFAFRDYIDAKPLFDLEDVLIRKRHKLIEQALM